MKNIVVLFLLMAFVGCKKDLNQNPLDYFGDANAFLTVSDVQLGVNGAYGKYFNYTNEMYANALLSDEAKLGDGNAGQGGLTYRYQFAADNTSGADVIPMYQAYYALIDHINRILPNVYTVIGSPGDLPRRNIVKGQLLALRAISHFSLLEYYADRYNPSNPGVPIMLVSNTLGKPSRNTTGEVISQIEADLAEAKTLVSPLFTDTTMNRINIAGYQARVALYKKDYQAAINYATEVIKADTIPALNLATGTTYANIWSDASTQELLFRIRTATGTGAGAIWTTTSNLVYVAASDKLVSSYGSGDIRLGAFVGDIGASNYVKKFHNSSKGARIVDVKAMRLSEMYLIRAEAYANQGNVADGTADLAFLRSKRSSPDASQTFANAADLLTAVILERFRELCFEGFRFLDLKRNNLPVQRNSTDAEPGWQFLDANSFRFTLPIPRDEINANPNTTQNPGYN